jgi:polysaccharide export outer membrane protein
MRVGDLNLSLHAITPDLVTAAGARPLPPPSEMEGLFTAKPGPYRIGPQDVLLATVWDHPEITLPMGPNRTDASSGNLVDEDGYIFFPYAGKIRVNGLSTGEVRDVLTTRLGTTLRNPQVDVKVLAYRSQKIYIGGEVRNPAVYTVTDVPFTLAEAINRAGGFLPTADDTRLLLTRGSHSWTLNFRDIMGAGAKLPGQIILREGDSLQIPSTTETPVYLMGEVVRPGTIPMLHGAMSLARAISEAGGLQQVSSDATSIYVVRSAGTAKNVDVFHLDARNPAAMVLADKFALNPHDVVYVDAGTLVRFSRVMNMILPTISATTQAVVVPVQIRYLRRNS